jgi:transcriptional regulator with XRE-family HTH domain
MGVTPETVSRWENGSAIMSASAERLLRLAALSREPISDYSLDLLKGVAQKKAAAEALKVRVARGAWSTEAA